MHRNLRSLPNHQSGTALLLLLVIASLGAASLIMQIFKVEHSDRARVRTTHSALGGAKEALLGFAMTHGRLPRPAISAIDGREQQEPCELATNCSGFLPWVALGITPEDGWGRRLHYSVSPIFTDEPVLAKFAVADKSVLSRDKDGNFFYRMGQVDCSVEKPCAPAIIYSTGKSTLGTSAMGIVQLNPSRSNIDEQHNQAAINEFIIRPASQEPTQHGGEFNHLVTWLSLRDLYLRMNVAGVLP